MKSLAVPPQPHSPLAQPAGAAIVTPRPPPTSRRAHAAAVLVESRAWAARCRRDGYLTDAARLEARCAELEAALGREPIEPVDARIRRLTGGGA